MLFSPASARAIALESPETTTPTEDHELLDGIVRVGALHKLAPALQSW